MVSTLGSGEQLNQTNATSHILEADDSEIWRKYQSLMAQNARGEAYFSPDEYLLIVKAAKESDSFAGWIRRSRNPPDVSISVQYAALLHPTYSAPLEPSRLCVENSLPL